VLRRLLAPQMLALHVVAVVAVLACALLGLWQLDRTRAFNQTAVDPAPAPITTVTQVEGSLRDGAAGRLVSLVGTYDATQQFTVTDRGGDPWVLTVLQVGATGPARPGVLVVRGRLAAGAVAPAPPTGLVEVIGRLQAAEPSSGAPATGSYELAAVSPVDLLTRVPYPCTTGTSCCAVRSRLLLRRSRWCRRRRFLTPRPGTSGSTPGTSLCGGRSGCSRCSSGTGW